MQAWDTLPVEPSRAGAPQRPWGGQRGEQPAENQTAEAAASGIGDLPAPRRGGLSAAAIATVGERLDEFGLRCRACCTTRPRATRANADTSRRGQLTRDHARHVATMARHMTGDDGQALQPCMANAP
jgi:hypothetical protein